MWFSHFNTDENRHASACSKSSDIEGVSAQQYPADRLLRRRNASSRSRSSAEQSPDHAGEAYNNRACTVARYRVSMDCPVKPCVRRTRRAYIVLEHASMILFTWSLAVRQSLIRTPRMTRLLTRVMPINVGGVTMGFPPAVLRVNIA